MGGASGQGGKDKLMVDVTIETGAVIQAPDFINEGDTIKVETSTRKYVGRDNS